MTKSKNSNGINLVIQMPAYMPNFSFLPLQVMRWSSWRQDKYTYHDQSNFINLMIQMPAYMPNFSFLPLQVAEMIINKCTCHDQDYLWSLPHLIQKPAYMQNSSFLPLQVTEIVILESRQVYLSRWLYPLRYPLGSSYAHAKNHYYTTIVITEKIQDNPPGSKDTHPLFLWLSCRENKFF